MYTSVNVMSANKLSKYKMHPVSWLNNLQRLYDEKLQENYNTIHFDFPSNTIFFYFKKDIVDTIITIIMLIKNR